MEWLTNSTQKDAKTIPNGVVGEPKATESFTVEQLKEMGIIGVYGIKKTLEEIQKEASNEYAKLLVRQQ